MPGDRTAPPFPMNVLGIETSCDETAAAVVRDGRDVLSNVVFSQVHLHSTYGGVVPEIASRQHVERLPGIAQRAVEEAGVGWAGIDAVAVTYAPGLASSLLVGIAAAKGLALALDRPLAGINHLEAHIYSAFMGEGAPRFEEECPFVALVVSGGHTSLLRIDALGRYRLLGCTVDDAAGEAFDKGAKLLDLGYPGGPAIDRASRGGNPASFAFPRGRQRHEVPGLNISPALCFSFSGLKTALLYTLRDAPLAAGDAGRLADLAASYQEAIVDALVDRLAAAAIPGRPVAVVGGVSMNRRLRDKLAAMAASRGHRLLLSAPSLCTDNAAMVAGLAGAGQGVTGPDIMALDAIPNLHIG